MIRNGFFKYSVALLFASGLVFGVLRDRMRGRWFARFYDGDDNEWCWTGKSIRNPWVRFAAPRVGATIHPPRRG